MVDINLFEEDSEEQDGFGDDLGGDPFAEEGSGESDPFAEEGGGESDPFADDGLGGDDFSGDLSLDDDLSDDDFGDDALLDSEEPIHDFEDVEDEDDDYAFEGSSKKGSLPPWLLYVVGGAVVVFLLIQYVVPMFFAPKPVAVSNPGVTRPRTQRPAATTTQAQQTTEQNNTEQAQPVQQQSQQQNQQQTSDTPVESAPVTQEAANRVSTQTSTAPSARVGQYDVLTSTSNVFDDLAKQGNAGVVIINGNQFLVEYVSATPGVSNTIGTRVKNMFGAEKFDASPEEKHKTGGRDNYWGVISGTLADGKAYGNAGSFASVTSFQNQVKALIKQNGLVLKSIEKPAGTQSGGKRPSSGHMIVEGPQKNLGPFIASLNQLPGQWGINKLLMAPKNITDFNATQAKMGITFWVAVQ